MDKPFFCAVAAQQAGESLVGTAGHYQTYVLIECPMPWAAKVFNSETIPPSLRQFIKEAKASRTVQFLCIDRGLSTAPEKTKVLVYERSTDRFCNGYDGHEFVVDGLEQVLPGLQAYWKGDVEIAPIAHVQDILVCTHGMRDKCCARFGQPLFMAARRLVASGALPNVRLWKASHIGGHRFAPTAIAFPDGRYYGHLTIDALQSIISRSGDITQLQRMYRGWGIVPAPIQVLEQQLMLRYGWDWFDCRISYQPLTSPAEDDVVRAEVNVQKPSGAVDSYQATIVRDAAQAVSLKASCKDAQPTVLAKYAVTDLKQIRSRTEMAMR